MQTPYATEFSANERETTPSLSSLAGVGKSPCIPDKTPFEPRAASAIKLHGLGHAKKFYPSTQIVNPPKTNDCPTATKDLNYSPIRQHEIGLTGTSNLLSDDFPGFSTFVDWNSTVNQLPREDFPVFSNNVVVSCAAPWTMVNCSTPLPDQHIAPAFASNWAFDTFAPSKELIVVNYGIDSVQPQVVDTAIGDVNLAHQPYHPPMSGQLAKDLTPELAVDLRYGPTQTIEIAQGMTGSNPVIRMTESSISKTPKNASAGRHYCLWRGCPSNRSFGRLTDLKRHVETFHIAPAAYSCIYEGCKMTFNRKDKLQGHVRKSHM